MVINMLGCQQQQRLRNSILHKLILEQTLLNLIRKEPPIVEQEEEEKVSYLLIWTGEKGRGIFNTWTLTDEERKKLSTYYEKYEAYAKPKTNTVFQRYTFFNRNQTQGEKIDYFVTELKLLAKDCSFHDADEMVRDRVVLGVVSHKVR